MPVALVQETIVVHRGPVGPLGAREAGTSGRVPVPLLGAAPDLLVAGLPGQRRRQERYAGVAAVALDRTPRVGQQVLGFDHVRPYAGHLPYPPRDPHLMLVP